MVEFSVFPHLPYFSYACGVKTKNSTQNLFALPLTEDPHCCLQETRFSTQCLSFVSVVFEKYLWYFIKLRCNLVFNEHFMLVSGEKSLDFIYSPLGESLKIMVSQKRSLLFLLIHRSQMQWCNVFSPAILKALIFWYNFPFISLRRTHVRSRHTNAKFYSKSLRLTIDRGPRLLFVRNTVQHTMFELRFSLFGF